MEIKHSFEIKGHERDLERIQYGIRGDKLYIEMEDSRGWNWFKKRQRDEVEVRIVLKRLDDLDISGTGEAMVAEMDQEDLTVDVSGTVDFETSGRIDYLNFDKSGAGSVYLHSLISKKVNIDKSGAGGFEMQGKANKLIIDCSGASTLDFEDFCRRYLRSGYERCQFVTHHCE